MTDEQEHIDSPKSDNDAAMAAFSDQREGLADALDTLYIFGNASGRNKFREKWPDVATYIFGDVLIGYDDQGTEDLERRKALEEEAEERRVFLRTTIVDMVEKSVDSGVLQFDYVGKIVDAFGGKISKSLYSESVIERVRPGVLSSSEPSPEIQSEPLVEQQPRPDEGLPPPEAPAEEASQSPEQPESTPKPPQEESTALDVFLSEREQKSSEEPETSPSQASDG